MIPLGRWLVERDARSSAPVPATPEPEREMISGPGMAETASPDHRPFLERIAMLEAALAAAEAAAGQERAVAAAREEELREALGNRLAEHLSSELAQAIWAMQSALEAALADILVPFLGEDAARRASTALQELVQQDLLNAAEPPLELLAPAELHATLSAALEKARIAVSIIEWPHLEVRHHGHTTRFEPLANEWRGILTGEMA